MASRTSAAQLFQARVLLQEELRSAARNEARLAPLISRLRVRPSLSTPSGNMLSRVLSKSTTLRSTPALPRTLSSGRELFTDSGSEESGKWLR